MTAESRTDFLAEVAQERTEVYARIAELLREQTYEAAKKANAMHLDWLRKHPDDYIALDAGEVISKSLSAYEFVQNTGKIQPAEHKPAATK